MGWRCEVSLRTKTGCIGFVYQYVVVQVAVTRTAVMPVVEYGTASSIEAFATPYLALEVTCRACLLLLPPACLRVPSFESSSSPAPALALASLCLHPIRRHSSRQPRKTKTRSPSAPSMLTQNAQLDAIMQPAKQSSSQFAAFPLYAHFWADDVAQL